MIEKIWDIGSDISAEKGGTLNSRKITGSFKSGSGDSCVLMDQPSKSFITNRSSTFNNSGANVFSGLPVSDPNNIGGLWKDSGIIKVSTQDVYYTEMTSSINVANTNQYLSGLDTGYIFIDLDFTKTQFISISLFRSSSILIEVFESFFTVVANGEEGYLFDINILDIRTIKVYLGTALRIEVNGEEFQLDGEAGLNTPLSFDESGDFLSFGDSSDGLIYKNITINDGTSDILSFKPPHTAMEFTETVQGNHGTYVERVLESYPPIGYSSPRLLKNVYISPHNQRDDLFEQPTVDFSTPSESIDIAYLRNIETQEPYLPSIPDGVDFPNWNETSIYDLERNPDCWYNQKAMTCFTVSSEFHNFAGHATLLSPRHAIIATHIWDDFGSPLDKYFYFMDLSGNIQKVKGLDSEDIGNDLTVVLLLDEVTLDVDYATFMLDSDIDNYDFRESTGCAPSKEGYFSIEKIAQLSWFGLRFPMEDEREWFWSRWYLAGLGSRSGDSSSPIFIHNGDKLFFTSISAIARGYPFKFGRSIGGGVGYNMKAVKVLLQTSMDDLDDNNGGLPHYVLVEASI